MDFLGPKHVPGLLMPLGRESLTAQGPLDGDGLLPVEPESFPFPDGSGASDSLKSPWLLPKEPGLLRNVCDLPRPPPSSRGHIQPEGYWEANPNSHILVAGPFDPPRTHDPHAIPVQQQPHHHHWVIGRFTPPIPPPIPPIPMPPRPEDAIVYSSLMRRRGQLAPGPRPLP